jgi:anti-anti-sigma factor
MAEHPLQYAAGTVRKGALVASVLVDDLRDTATAYGLRDELVALLEASRATCMVLDLKNVRSIGSIGFLAFLAVRRRLAGGPIVLCSLSEPVQKTFELCQLISNDRAKAAAFDVADTLDDALARLSAQT